MLDGPDLADSEVTEALNTARTDPSATTRPSVETAMHAALLDIEGIAFVGHTHPTAINAIGCSEHFHLLSKRLFPDHIVVCGPSAGMVDYVDPGLPLARAVRDCALRYREQFGGPPQTIYLKNHGFIAMGKSALQVSQITAMADKAARILLGALSAGAPVFMDDQQVSRIAGRDDEHYRQKILAAASTASTTAS
jgi:rhamnose utilization protein RhaD (predicted bifunctional aldolase and dehydrogenase)